MIAIRSPNTTTFSNIAAIQYFVPRPALQRIIMSEAFQIRTWDEGEITPVSIEFGFSLLSVSLSSLYRPDYCQTLLGYEVCPRL